MKKINAALLCLVTFLIPFLSNGQQQVKQDERSLLWRISSKDMKQPSWLFGTIHMICPSDYIWTTAMKQSLEKSQEVCFELDLDDPQMMMQIATGMLNKEGKTLKDYFSEADYAKLAKYVTDSLGLNISIFQQMKPIALETLFSTNNSECETPESYENNIMNAAKKTNKEITGLESVDEQLDLFDNLPTDSVIKDIMKTVNGVQDDRSDYRKLVTAYKQQDLPALHNMILQSATFDLDLGGFLDVRNEKWIPRMIEKMDRKSVFFAVGAGHLPGENGVINLLKKAGYTVTPVK